MTSNLPKFPININKQSNVNIKVKRGAAYNIDCGNINLELSKFTSVNTYNKQDLSPLMIACQYQLPEVVELLLRYGGNVKSTNAYHQNPLHIAVQPKLSFCPQFNSNKLD